MENIFQFLRRVRGSSFVFPNAVMSCLLGPRRRILCETGVKGNLRSFIASDQDFRLSRKPARWPPDLIVDLSFRSDYFIILHPVVSGDRSVFDGPLWNLESQLSS